MKHLNTLFSTSAAQVEEIFEIAADLKAKLAHGERPPLLAGRVMTLLFEKPSLRTRISFEAAMTHLGGSSVFLSTEEAGLKGRESIADVARVLGGYSDCIVMRTYAQSLIDQFAEEAGCPIINGLSNDSHPCQSLTDLFTIREVFGSLAGRKLVYVGDGNNVACSLAIGAALMKVPFVVSSPAGYELKPDFLQHLKQTVPDVDIALIDDPQAAVEGADVIYTDVWASMGQETESDARKRVFAPYMVDTKLMSAASADAKFMHCLPAKRGLEVSDEVLDGPQSIAFEQAENRMHVAKAVLVWLLGGDGE